MPPHGEILVIPVESRRALDDDLLLLPGGPAVGGAANGYAILADGRMLLVDAVFRQQLEAVRVLRREGHAPAALVLTHRHAAAQANALRAFHAELRVPVYLHPADALHPHARNKGIPYLDPTGPDDVLAAFGVEAVHFPGHTGGHVLLRWRAHGGVLFTGSAAVVESDGVARPPAAFSHDDEELRRSWAGFHLPAAALCPFHGPPLVDRAADMPRLLAALSAPALTLAPLP
jgi:glyoxylase-like metal-dependent hydrolase (beta-lactamase superfamily II)